MEESKNTSNTHPQVLRVTSPAACIPEREGEQWPEAASTFDPSAWLSKHLKPLRSGGPKELHDDRALNTPKHPQLLPVSY